MKTKKSILCSTTPPFGEDPRRKTGLIAQLVPPRRGLFPFFFGLPSRRASAVPLPLPQPAGARKELQAIQWEDPDAKCARPGSAQAKANPAAHVCYTRSHKHFPKGKGTCGGEKGTGKKHFPSTVCSEMDGSEMLENPAGDGPKRFPSSFRVGVAKTSSSSSKNSPVLLAGRNDSID
jgi:hypothetical protein